MGRKKKPIEENKFTPSKYQQDIYDYIEKGNGNLVIEASAGAGKTSTLIEALKFINDDKKILFCAFNKDIVTELEKRIEKKDNINISTIHSLGLKMLTTNFKDEVSRVPNPTKYRSHIYNFIKDYSSLNLFYLPKVSYINYIDTINKLVNLLRLYLIDNIKDAQQIINKYDLPIIGDEIEVALNIMEWGKNNIETIDYIDMIWLPNVLYLKPFGQLYDYIFIDECQDLNVSQRELIFKCKKNGTRMICCGDKNQCLYSFIGSDPNSFEILKSMPNTISLPLSISYRCPKRVVKFAQNVVPTIEYKDDADDGEIVYNAKFEDIQDGDMILCRNNAPLMKIYSEFLKLDKKCYIRGKDIGNNLISFAKSTKQDKLNISMDCDGVFVRLYSHLFDIRDRISNEMQISKKDAMNTTICQEIFDKIKALEFLSENLTTIEELENKIKGIFSDRNKKGISLSTIHKAKGLEANNVYIACRSLMPSKSAKKDWEMLQEKNLMFVAYTRAKNKLGFLSEEDFKQFSNQENEHENLNNLEFKINIILNKKANNISTNSLRLNRMITASTKIRENNVQNITNINLTNNNIKQSLSLGRKKISQIKKNIYL